MKKFIIFVSLTICFVSNKLIHATGFEDFLPLRSKSLALNEGGFIFNVMKKEIWQDIKGWEGYYQISNFGRVKSLARYVNHWRGGKSLNKERILKQTKTKRYGKIGYVRISLMRHSKAKHYHAHRLIALCLIPNPENKPCVNHINGIKTDNRIANLAWCTYSENERHSWDKLGKQPNSTCFKKAQK